MRALRFSKNLSPALLVPMCLVSNRKKNVFCAETKSAEEGANDLNKIFAEASSGGLQPDPEEL